jgi:hypothetical protein
VQLPIGCQRAGLLGKENCIAFCVDVPHIPDLPRPPAPPKLNYSSCGGFTRKPRTCLSPMSCIDNPYSVVAGDCGMPCDGPGICVRLMRLAAGRKRIALGGRNALLNRGGVTAILPKEAQAVDGIAYNLSCSSHPVSQ